MCILSLTTLLLALILNTLTVTVVVDKSQGPIQFNYTFLALLSTHIHNLCTNNIILNINLLDDYISPIAMATACR